jgi:hypothetical protein
MLIMPASEHLLSNTAEPFYIYIILIRFPSTQVYSYNYYVYGDARMLFIVLKLRFLQDLISS